MARPPPRSPRRPHGAPTRAARRSMGQDRPPAQTRGARLPGAAPLVPPHRTGRAAHRTLVDPLVPVRLSRRGPLGTNGVGRRPLGRARGHRDRPAPSRSGCARPHGRLGHAFPVSRSFDRRVSSEPGTLPSAVPPSDLSHLHEQRLRLLLLLSERLGCLDIRHRGSPFGSRRSDRDLVRRRAAPDRFRRLPIESLEELGNAFGAPQTIATDVNRTSQGYPSMAVGGLAKDETGAQIRFLAITIKGPDENRAIMVLFPDRHGPP